MFNHSNYTCMKSLKIPKGQSESVYRRRADNTMAKRKSTKWQTTIYKRDIHVNNSSEGEFVINLGVRFVPLLAIMTSFLDETNCFRYCYQSIINVCKCKSINIRENRRIDTQRHRQHWTNDTGRRRQNTTLDKRYWTKKKKHNIGQTILDEEKKTQQKRNTMSNTNRGWS